jgi:hypothetical protein
MVNDTQSPTPLSPSETPLAWRISILCLGDKVPLPPSLAKDHDGGDSRVILAIGADGKIYEVGSTVNATVHVASAEEIKNELCRFVDRLFAAASASPAFAAGQRDMLALTQGLAIPEKFSGPLTLTRAAIADLGRKRTKTAAVIGTGIDL